MKKVVIVCLSLVVLAVAIAYISTVPGSSDTSTTTIQNTALVPGVPTEPSAPIPTASSETTFSQAAMKLQLITARTMGFIEVDAYGTGSFETIKIDITSKSGAPIEVTISPGTIFNPQSGGDKSSMVVVEEKKILLEPNQASGLVSVGAASISMRQDVPVKSDALTLDDNTAGGDLRKLLKLSDFQGEPSFHLQQFAIWTITDNPERDDYVGVGSGSGPSNAEIEKIRLLFQKAGLQPEEYRALKTAIYFDLIDAKSKGLIEVGANGVGSLESIKLSLTSKSDDVLEISISVGTIFDALSTSIQGMVVITQKTVILYPREVSLSVSVDAACANMRLSMPRENDALTLRTVLASGDLMKLLSLPDFQKKSYRIQQFAIWTITDNPTRNGYMGISIGFQLTGSGPSSSEIEDIRNLFIQAGIQTDQYRVFQP